MKKFITIILALAISSFYAGCKKDSGTISGDRKYEIKAGSYTYSIPLPGLGPVETTTYFDDYGAKECIETKAEIKMFGQSIKQHSRTITKDGYSYTLDLVSKTGTKMKMDDAMTPDMKAGFAAMAVAMKDSIKIKELGTEDFLGKSCRKIEVSMADGKSAGVYWLWKNISLKMETKDPSTGKGFTMAATKVEELSSVPSEIFAIPSDIKITETKMPKMD